MLSLTNLKEKWGTSGAQGPAGAGSSDGKPAAGGGAARGPRRVQEIVSPVHLAEPPHPAAGLAPVMTASLMIADSSVAECHYERMQNMQCQEDISRLPSSVAFIAVSIELLLITLKGSTTPFYFQCSVLIPCSSASPICQEHWS